MAFTKEDLEAVTQAREILKVAAARSGIYLAEHTAGREGEQDDDTVAFELLVHELHKASDHATAAVRELERRVDSPERGR